ncbi:MAG: class I SAM-dependent methyltransferase [Candidatus Izemoplasmataceae bacterium]
MNNYTKENKRAWEEAFEKRSKNFDETTLKRLTQNPSSMFTKNLKNALKNDAKNDKILAQFCCNNGRETMAALSFGYQEVFGFDIAENMVHFANQTAQTNHLKATFIAKDLLLLKENLYTFDTALLTVGALCWFKDLNALFSSIASTLKKGARIIIEDMHPFCNMLAEKEDKLFNKNHPMLPVINYFKDTPWIENSGMGYMTEDYYESSTFISYSHTFSAILNALTNNNFVIKTLVESDIDQANLFGHLDQKGYPLTYLLVAEKQ